MPQIPQLKILHVPIRACFGAPVGISSISILWGHPPSPSPIPRLLFLTEPSQQSPEKGTTPFSTVDTEAEKGHLSGSPQASYRLTSGSTCMEPWVPDTPATRSPGPAWCHMGTAQPTSCLPGDLCPWVGAPSSFRG